MCLVAFQKIFQKIFSSVWKRRRKTQIQKNTSHNPEKNHQRRQIQSDGTISRRRDRNRRRDLAKRRSRSRIFLSRTRSSVLPLPRAVVGLDRDLGRSCRLFLSRALALSLSLCFLSRACSLSLSLFFRKCFEVKMEVENDFRGQRYFFSVNGFQFSENRIFRTNQTASFSKKHFQK